MLLDNKAFVQPSVQKCTRAYGESQDIFLWQQKNPPPKIAPFNAPFSSPKTNYIENFALRISRLILRLHHCWPHIEQ
jgi:hypothetical protein